MNPVGSISPSESSHLRSRKQITSNHFPLVPHARTSMLPSGIFDAGNHSTSHACCIISPPIGHGGGTRTHGKGATSAIPPWLPHETVFPAGTENPRSMSRGQLFAQPIIVFFIVPNAGHTRAVMRFPRNSVDPEDSSPSTSMAVFFWLADRAADNQSIDFLICVHILLPPIGDTTP